MSAPAAPPLIEARELRVRYGSREALVDVSLTVARGELLAIIGPNGSGKSTLLRTLARMQRPGAGVVQLGGVDLWALSPRAVARRVAFLPQAPDAPADLTVEELVWHGRYPHRGLLAPPTPADGAAVERALAWAGVDELRARPLGTLSGGERQRAWVALALAQEPELLLLDEPTTFLDLGHQHELLALLRRLNAERGLTVVMVMHDVAQAAQYAPRMLALLAGRVLLDGPPADVVTPAHLATLFGARLAVLRDPVSGAPAIVPAPL
ncbi:MAG: ABC transporter ATP-binding protein [Dehalococcoidia bacterium]|nr:ABC transporter ATP-binding protein [Dehalococcoidia bacterium]